MNIHQFSVNYIQEQDRILLRINTTEGEELRLWLTRRLCLGFQPMLQKIVGEWVAKQEAVKSPLTSPIAAADTQTQQMLAEFKREESIQTSDFKTPYKPPAKLPLGTEPLLVTEVHVTPLNNGQLQIAFNEKLSAAPGQPHNKPRGFRMALKQKLVHGLIHLLDKAVLASHWSSVTAVGTGPAEPKLPGEGNAGGSGGERPRYLN